MNELVEKLRDMHALAADSCDPTFNRALLESADAISRLQAENAKLTERLERAEREISTTMTMRLQAENERLQEALKDMISVALGGIEDPTHSAMERIRKAKLLTSGKKP